MAPVEHAAQAVRNSQITVLNLYRRVRFSPQLPRGFYHFRNAATMCGVIVAQTTAIGVYRQPPDATDQIAIGNETPALTFFTEPQIFNRQQDGNGETVVSR